MPPPPPLVSSPIEADSEEQLREFFLWLRTCRRWQTAIEKVNAVKKKLQEEDYDVDGIRDIDIHT